MLRDKIRLYRERLNIYTEEINQDFLPVLHKREALNRHLRVVTWVVGSQGGTDVFKVGLLLR